MSLECSFSGYKVGIQRAYDGDVPLSGYRKNHTEDVFCCWYIRHGSAHLQYHHSKLTAHSGQWVFIPAGLKRDQSFATGTQLLSLRFTLETEQQQPVFTIGEPLISDGQLLPKMLAIAQETVQHWNALPQGFERLTLMTAKWLQFISAWWGVVRADNRWRHWQHAADPRLVRALGLLYRHQCPTIPWQRLEEASAYSRRHLDRLCKLQTGRSLSEILHNHLLAQAHRRLADDKVPVKAIAHELGFADASSFARWFRRQTGVTPKERRRQAVI